MSGSIRKVTQIGLGDNADPTKNFVISVPDVADGTLKITRGDGTSVLNIDAAGKAVFPGNAQTTQAFTSGQRVFGTPYQNLTGQDIVVNPVATSGQAANIIMTINGVVFTGAGGAAGVYLGSGFRIPTGATYTAGVNAGTPTFISWSELR